jgi:hypothetical protein
MHDSDALATHLAALPDFWTHWGFIPWHDGPFAGVARTQRFIKGGLIGCVAEYHAWEAILWTPGSEEARQELWKKRSPMPEVITQRFLFLLPAPRPERRIRSFCFGLRGYLEFYAYYPGSTSHNRVQDLAGLVDLALKLRNPLSPSPLFA